MEVREVRDLEEGAVMVRSSLFAVNGNGLELKIVKEACFGRVKKKGKVSEGYLLVLIERGRTEPFETPDFSFLGGNRCPFSDVEFVRNKRGVAHPCQPTRSQILQCHRILLSSVASFKAREDGSL